MVDRLFKSALLMVLLAFLYIAWGMKDNGRYVYHPETGHERVRGFSRIVIDSRTGTLFAFDIEQNSFLEFHPQTGETAQHWTWSNPRAKATKIPKDDAEFRALPLIEAMDILEIATPEQKRQFMPLAVEKLRSESVRMPINEFREAAQRLKRIKDAMPEPGPER
jgi:hypothetical protein